MLRCEVAYARRDQKFVLNVQLPEGGTARDALVASGLLERCAEIDPATTVFGVFGRVVSADHPLKDGDRVEIYRPLKVDPRTARRVRAKQTR